MTTFKCIANLEENPAEVFLEVSAILLRLVDNVLLYPSNPKYRKIRLENKIISTVIMPSIGAMECLFELGFQEGDDALLLPLESTSVEKLTRFRTEISTVRNKYLKKTENTSKENGLQGNSNAKVERQSTPQPEASSQPGPSTPVDSSTSSSQFLSKLHTMSSMVLQYEQDGTRRKALSVVPLSEINERVQSRMRHHQKQALKSGEPMNEASLQETIFFTELMAWFKGQFFQWVNSPKCSTCAGDTQFLEMSSNSTSERVEVYKCGQCSVRVLFPRINDAARLLDTRCGRCGEWANAFTAVCRALGWEARYVYDETDHVWTEVYFKSEGRWVHLDPCECALDKPLLYEKGWGKKLTYVIAFSCHDVQDVTWRYSANHSAVLARRTRCSEQQLVHTIQHLNQLRQANLSVVKRKALARRTVLELIQLMSPAVDMEGDTQGRQSGSLAWRLARQETTLSQSQHVPYVWTPTLAEMEANKLTVSYNTSSDEYTRGVGGERLKGWQAGASSVENMFRKEENDWKIVYLCRTENSTEGKICWRIDLSEAGLTIDQVAVRCPSAVYQSGKVIWLLCSGDKCVRITNGETKTLEFRGSNNVTLSAMLSGGDGDLAWQHAQLFRQSVSTTDVTLHISVTFTKS